LYQNAHQFMQKRWDRVSTTVRHEIWIAEADTKHWTVFPELLQPPAIYDPQHIVRLSDKTMYFRFLGFVLPYYDIMNLLDIVCRPK
jgi:hypothetical protein